MRWTSEHRAFAVEAYFSNNHFYVAVQYAFRTHFGIKPRGPVRDRKSIVLWVENFRTTESVVKKSSGRQRTVTTPENVEAVRQSILRPPRRSARKHAVSLDISNHSMRRILHEHLNFHPYKMVVVQELSPCDFQNRITVCETLLENLPPDTPVFFSNEAHFHLSGYANKQNMRYWSGNNPRELHERPLHSDKVTVCCALSRVGVIGPYFFEEDNNAVTVNSQRYVDKIKNFFEPALEELHLGNVWFQQDGATAHTARASMTVLREKFPRWLISLRGDIPWAVYSPDLTPCDFLWGYLKAEVFKHRPTNVLQLKNVIRQEVAQNPVQTGTSENGCISA
ncbi:hypothetical protein B7P43_G05130 [Cryptotermes secundus]|uniref:DUF4817 domain-containing protein n=1 Tax=Cryptotermes secundus TaxID=105785 RepID=A0A2J7PEX8_9NEOP|nr:hypothetical protein B7P43_G05130 [Cryptotermes secundus]